MSQNVSSKEWLREVLAQSPRVVALVKQGRGVSRYVRLFYIDTGYMDLVELTPACLALYPPRRSKHDGIPVQGYGFCAATNVYDHIMDTLFGLEPRPERKLTIVYV